MQVKLDSNGNTEVEISDSDICYNCLNSSKCPLIGALQKEIVIMRYEYFSIDECPLFKTKFIEIKE